MTEGERISKVAKDDVESPVRLRLSPLASLIVRARWFRNMSGLAIRPAGSVWARPAMPQPSDPATDDDGRQPKPLDADELRIIRRNALLSALMRSGGTWGR